MNIETDILIIGGGGAATRAAIEAAKNQLKVTMVIKGKFPSGSTVIAMGSMAAVIRDDDTPDLFYKDIIEGGYHLNNKELARILANESKTAYEDLVTFGTEFQASKKGALYISQPSGMTRSRALLSIDHMFMKGLIAEVKNAPIDIYENIMIIELLKENDTIVGAVGFNYLTGEFIVISAKAIVLATGGSGQIFQLTSNPQEATGDGYAMGLNIGAELIDMEFTQAMTCVVFPIEIRGLAPPFDGFVKYGAKFYNGLNERYMEKYEPEKMENVTRDVACICGYKEIQAGNACPNGGVLLDISSIPWSVMKNLMPKIYHAYDNLGIDASKTGIEWAPGCHHEMGGLRINGKCETTVKGLFAAGEVTGGVHGANRLGGNSLTETQVFGKIAGKSAANFALNARRLQLSPEIIEEKRKNLFTIYNRTKGIDHVEIREKLKQMMSENVWIIKSEKKLKIAIKSLNELRNNASLNLKLRKKTYKDLKEAWETLNMLEVAQVLTCASLLRTESRGAHYREDYPEKDDENWLKNIIFYKKVNKLKWYINSNDPI